MNVNVKVRITDAERNTLAGYLDGNSSKRLATRKDVNDFLRGCIDHAITNMPTTVEQLRGRGCNDSYIRGWLQVANRHSK